MRLIGVDTGGTFTDLVWIDEENGRTKSVKVFSTRRDPSAAVMEAVGRVQTPLDELGLFMHGTTVATNAVLERAGARVGLLTTAGQLDRLDLQRCNLTRLYDFFYTRPTPLVARSMRREVSERLRADGSVYKALDEEGVRQAVAELTEAGAEVIAVCFLNSYVNPSHEQQAAEVVRQVAPAMPVVLSSEILPEILEYERFSTTALSAYLTPVMTRYLTNLERSLTSSGFSGQFRVMQGNGGLMDNATARARAATTLESGPAAGVTGAVEIARRLGTGDLITLDMGGTSTDVCLVKDGLAATTADYTIDGLPMRQPLLDIVSVGAGGGSIAWIDEGGGLHVGPVSAGAEPGPACYGRGGREATVTDAHVVLGRLSPAHPLGGILTVDGEAAHDAVAKIAGLLTLGLEAAAAGILTIAEANMVNAIKLISVERGIDPREFLLVAYGGAGPLSAGRVADALGIRRVLIPPSPGIHSALGLTLADLRHDFVRTVLRPTDELRWDELEPTIEALESSARELLRTEGVDGSQIRMERSFDMRYRGQAYIPVSVPLSVDARNPSTELAARFHQLHQDLYKHAAPEEPTEVVSVRITAIGTRTRSTPKADIRSDHRSEAARLPVYFTETNGVVDCPFWERDQLPAGFESEGPCIVSQMDATTVVYPNQTLSVDVYRNILIETR